MRRVGQVDETFSLYFCRDKVEYKNYTIPSLHFTK